MRTINWRHTDWNARNFIFSIGQEIVGQLSFNNLWNYNAVFTDNTTRLKFTRKNFLDRNVIITKGDTTIGEIDFGLFGNQTLKLVNGETYTLTTSLWEQEAYWKTERGDTIVKYEQATMSSMGKGTINLDDSLTIETEKLLISAGLFARQLKHKRAILVVLMAILIAAASRHH